MVRLKDVNINIYLYVDIFYLTRKHAILVAAHAMNVLGSYIHFIGKRAIYKIWCLGFSHAVKS